MLVSYIKEDIKELIMFVVREEDRLADIRKKISIIKTIIQKCEQITTHQVEASFPLLVTEFLTNEPKEKIEEALRHPKTRELKSLIESYEDLKMKAERSRILSCHIHEMLYNSYVNNRNLLKLQDMLVELEKIDDIEDVLEVIKSRGFIWKKLSGDKCVLIEDPEVQAKRIKYLLDMRRFRENNRTFVFVDERAIPADIATLNEYLNTKQLPKSGTFQYVRIAASPVLGLLALSINNTTETFSNWLTNEVTSHLKESYVVVLEEKMMKEAPINTPPNPEAKQKDMIDWLERNNIQFSSTMHRAELYELIDTFKDKLSGEKTFTDEVLKGKGVELLKRPDGWPKLNFFEPMWNLDSIWTPCGSGDVAGVLGKRIQMMVDLAGLDIYQLHFNDLEDIETGLFEKDMELEEVIDKLFTMAKDVEMPDVGLPNYWEVESNDIEKYVKLFSGCLTSPTTDKF